MGSPFRTSARPARLLNVLKPEQALKREGSACRGESAPFSAGGDAASDSTVTPAGSPLLTFQEVVISS